MDIDLEFQRDQNGLFHLKDLLLRVRVIRDEHEVFEIGHVDLLVLGRNEEGRHGDQLQPCPLNLCLL